MLAADDVRPRGQDRSSVGGDRRKPLIFDDGEVPHRGRRREEIGMEAGGQRLEEGPGDDEVSACNLDDGPLTQPAVAPRLRIDAETHDLQLAVALHHHEVV